ncbi:DUF6215 domain-containing protein [Streptomyces sp. NPDC008150]|uniref:DUF6215 domain-containing protein n=1 Tax=Streptomyces sp. NPDC008150 TaxID=3364816 RepID=UPI0036E8D1D7
MAEEVTAPRRGGGTGAQVVAALAFVGVVVAAMWALNGAFKGQAAAAQKKPATCTRLTEVLPARYTSGARLCSVLNRPDLPAMLGTPEDHVQTADGSGNWITLAGGDKIAAPEAHVETQTYSVKLSVDYDHLTVSQMADLFGKDAEPRTVLGHPAVLYSDHTITFSLGGDGGTRPGGIARHLVVAKSAKDGGGSFEVVIWRQDDVPPDDTALLNVARMVLPTVPGWVAG